ncbi:isochorismatase hydrolase [Klebsormidium nitens]|uniref:Isochorismatase hydrolase n=1 Tax=Klebsormidium nitens TaxID=105231 RepID=A0A1Y1HLP1_KLENI|nr:isochorismatase hydrolase [Klebsormidium nitens]|eukprot:GAQ79545.1 isochorismatase hydrolase [Klebsormidium nitens]
MQAKDCGFLPGRGAQYYELKCHKITTFNLNFLTGMEYVIKAQPRDFKSPVGKTALLLLKLQHDFLEPGGYAELLGNDLSKVQSIRPEVAKLLEAAREAKLTVVHVAEAYKPDLSDLAPSKASKTKKQTGGVGIGDEGSQGGRILIQGEIGTQFVDDAAPLDGEKIVYTPGKGIGHATDVHEFLVKEEIRYVLVAGLETDITVQIVMRELNDRGFDPLLVDECTASYNPDFKAASLTQITAQGGIIGWVASLDAVLSGLSSPESAGPPEPVDEAWAKVPWIGKPDPLVPAVVPLPANYENMKRATVEGAKPWPFTFPVEATALVMIDMQRDFVEEGGFGSTLGNNVKLLQAIVPTVRMILDTFREFGMPIVHTLEAHYPDLSDAPLAKLTRGQLPVGLRIGDEGEIGGRILVRNEEGNGIVDENAPAPNEKAIHKPGKGAFYQTDIYEFLLSKGVTHLLFGGVTTEVCVQTTMREACDRGFECLMVTDATESYFPEFKSSTLEILASQGAIVGWTASAQEVRDALLASKETHANGTTS